ncbi:MAG: amidohydrolase family protein [Victivallaceae bacterium]|nr:amidohydrolase family protein [Victivallaceae bacterium]
MFIDIHAHAYLYPSPPQDGHTQFPTPEEVIKRQDELGIECAILLPLIGPEVYLPQSNEEIIETCRSYPRHFLPACNIDPRGISNSVNTDFSIWLDWYKEHGCILIGEFMPNLPFLHPLVQNFFKQAECSGLPLTFDISTAIGNNYGLYDDQGLPQLEKCLQNFPDLKIFGHGPAFWAEIGQLETPGDRSGYPRYPIKEEGAVPKLLRHYENMWGDLSAGSGYYALERDPEYAAKFLTEFQDKLCFGTDMCSADADVPLPRFLIDLKDNGKITPEVFRKIARENAIKLFKLPLDHKK